MKHNLLYLLLFLSFNAFGQTSDDIQRKIDSLQAEKKKIDLVNNPKIIERLLKSNDSLHLVRSRMLKEVENITQSIEKNNKRILGLKFNVNVPEFKETRITTKVQLPFKSSPDFVNKPEFWIPVNSSVFVTSLINDQWVELKYDNKVGYILTSFLDIYPEIDDQVKKINQQNILFKEADLKNRNTAKVNTVKTNSYQTNTGTSTNIYTPSSSSSSYRSTDVYSSSSSTSSDTYQPRGYDSPQQVHTGPRGGRYYINKNGNKTYLKRN